MAKLYVSRRADQDVRAIWRYIADRNLVAANDIVERIDRTFRILADFPVIGTPRDDLRPGLRMLVEGNYLLLYEYDEDRDEVELIAVIDGRRDLRDAL